MYIKELVDKAMGADHRYAEQTEACDAGVRVRMPADMLSDLKISARENHCSVSAEIRRAVRVYFEVDWQKHVLRKKGAKKKK